MPTLEDLFGTSSIFIGARAGYATTTGTIGYEMSQMMWDRYLEETRAAEEKLREELEDKRKHPLFYWQETCKPIKKKHPGIDKWKLMEIK